MRGHHVIIWACALCLACCGLLIHRNADGGALSEACGLALAAAGLLAVSAMLWVDKWPRFARLVAVILLLMFVPLVAVGMLIPGVPTWVNIVLIGCFGPAVVAGSALQQLISWNQPTT